MSSKNIFKTTAGIDQRIRATSMFKDRSSPYKRPPQEEKKERKEKHNNLIDIDSPENTLDLIKDSLFDRIIEIIMTLLGKKSQWKETRAKLQTLQNRINSFEEIINESKAHTSKKMKDYSV